ncbi:MAG TPA: hypothetical protein VN878_06920, partial [Usitatibacter sp.]|nr:hypothetical protein [Usitatibacter sp.]
MMATTPEFAAARTPSAWRQKLAGFWRWWTHEIAQLLPERFSGLTGSARVPLVSMSNDELTLLEPHTNMGSGDAYIAWGGLDSERRRAALRKLLERAGETRGRVRLRLGRDEALVRRVSLPAATEENLAQVLTFEMDRLTPF